MGDAIALLQPADLHFDLPRDALYLITIEAAAQLSEAAPQLFPLARDDILVDFHETRSFTEA